MADTIERTVFSEGEILRAQDLNAAFEQGRGRDARHARQEHRWGIVQGLELRGAAGPMGFDVTLTAGVARDSRGREILVPRDERLTPDAFNVTGDKEAWFPVFLVGLDEAASTPGMGGACGGGARQGMRETYELQIGRAQEVDTWESDQTEPEVDEGPDAPQGQEQPRVLVGFVQWDTDQGNFKAVSAKTPSGARARRAGLRGNAIESADARVLMLLGDSEDEALSIQQGKKEPLLKLESSGDLWIKGALKSVVKQGVQVSSGIATDGTRLPLPVGMSESDAAALNVNVFVQALASSVPQLVVECGVDAQRRVRCLVRPFTGALDQSTNKYGPGGLDVPRPWSVSYLVVVSPKGGS